MDDWRKELARNLMIAANAYFLGNTLATEERRPDKYPDPGPFWLELAEKVLQERQVSIDQSHTRAAPRD
jgi:hypothetical protein